MKQYRQFLKEMPSKTIVFAFGRFSPPTTGHELLVKSVKKIASSNNADHIIYASRTQDKKKNPLSVDKKIHYLNLMFSNTNFKAANDAERTFMEVAKELNKKYKNLIMVAGSDRVASFEKLLNQYNGVDYNYDSIQVISAGERDPDADDASGMSGTKMRTLAVDGNYESFKKGLPHSIRDIDGKRLMNDVRLGMGHEVIKEQIKINVDSLREQYYNKEIFNIGDMVESKNEPFEIVDRGSNYLVLVDSQGNTRRKWIQEVTMSDKTLFTDAQFQDKGIQDSKEISFKGYTTKNLHNADGAACAFQKSIDNVGTVDPVSILNALKATDSYLELTPEKILDGGKESQSDLLAWSKAHLDARRALDHSGEFINHIHYWHLYKDKLDQAVFTVRVYSDQNPIKESAMLDKNKDKLKVAKVIASILGVDDADKSSNPEQLVNNALRKSKSLNKDSLKIVNKMLKLADEVGINYDKKIIKASSPLTTEQYQLAYNRAEKYGRRFPNPIDTSWVMSESKTPSIVVDKSKSNNMSSLRPDDEKKLVAINNTGKGKVVNIPTESIDPKTKKEIENYANTGHTSGDTTPTGAGQPEYTHVGSSLTSDGDDTIARMKAKKIRNESVNEEKCCEKDDEEDHDKMSEQELDKLIDSLEDDDYFDAYDEDELHIIDAETGEKIEHEKGVNEEALNEVLSKMERIKAKFRMSKYAPKLARKRMIALRQHSDSKKINHRARHLAVNLLKKKLLKGRSISTASVGEKERMERMISKKKVFLNRAAMKLVPRIKKLEQTRLSHKNFTNK